jgi:hypothetical protein
MKRKLGDAYRFARFRPDLTVRGIFGDPKARVITLIRRSKKQSAVAVGKCSRGGMTGAYGESEIFPVATCGFIWRSKYDACSVSVVGV